MNKLIFFIAWIGIFILSLLGVTSVVYPKFFQDIDVNSLLFKGIVLGVSLIYIIITLIKLKSKFPPKVDYEVESEGGKITVSSGSIKSMVKGIFANQEGINLVKITTKRKRSSFILDLEIESALEESFANKSMEIQEKIKKEIKEVLGVEISQINVKLLKIKK